LLAGLQSIQDELHEAAAVDGATAWQRFRTITLPQLRPVIIAITTLDFIWNFNSFGLVYVLTEGAPGGAPSSPCSSPTSAPSAAESSDTPRRSVTPWSS